MPYCESFMAKRLRSVCLPFFDEFIQEEEEKRTWPLSSSFDLKHFGSNPYIMTPAKNIFS